MRRTPYSTPACTGLVSHDDFEICLRSASLTLPGRDSSDAIRARSYDGLQDLMSRVTIARDSSITAIGYWRTTAICRTPHLTRDGSLDILIHLCFLYFQFIFIEAVK